MNFKVTAAYDGTRYDGWQKQGNTANTIQAKLEAILSKLEGEAVEIVGAGRTDAGVHALGQVFHVKLNSKQSEEEVFEYLNRYLPEDIAVKKVEAVDLRFHSRYQAVGKKYLYRIWNGNAPDPFQRKYQYHLPKKLDVEAMKNAAGFLTGTWDFQSFCANKRMKKSTVRALYDISIEQKGEEITILYYGNGFLYHMARILTGTLIEVGQGLRSAESVKEILEKKDRQAAGFTAPAKGLFLMEVLYDSAIGETVC